MQLGRTVDELLDSVSYPELVKWGLYYQVEPFGEWRGDVRIAQLAALLANVNRDPKKQPQPFKIEDFMPFEKLAAKPPEKTAQQGTRVAPETVAWLFAMGRRSKRAQ